MATFHTAVTRLPHPRRAWLDPTAVDRPTQSEDDPVVRAARRLVARGRALFARPLPRGIIHGDLWAANMLVARNDPRRIAAILDLEEAETNPLVLDLARTMLSVGTDQSGRRLDGALVAAAAQGYSSVRPLTADETRHLPHAIRYVGGALVLWVKRTGAAIDPGVFLDRVESAESRPR